MIPYLRKEIWLFLMDQNNDFVLLVSMNMCLLMTDSLSVYRLMRKIVFIVKLVTLKIQVKILIGLCPRAVVLRIKECKKLTLNYE